MKKILCVFCFCLVILQCLGGCLSGPEDFLEKEYTVFYKEYDEEKEIYVQKTTVCSTSVPQTQAYNYIKAIYTISEGGNRQVASPLILFIEIKEEDFVEPFTLEISALINNRKEILQYTFSSAGEYEIAFENTLFSLYAGEDIVISFTQTNSEFQNRPFVLCDIAIASDDSEELEPRSTETEES